MPVLEFTVPYDRTPDTLRVGVGRIEVAGYSEAEAPLAIRQTFTYDIRPPVVIDMRLAGGLLWETRHSLLPGNPVVTARSLAPEPVQGQSDAHRQTQRWRFLAPDNPLFETFEYRSMISAYTGSETVLLDERAMSDELRASRVWAAIEQQAGSVTVIGDTLYVPTNGPVTGISRLRDGSYLARCIGRYKSGMESPSAFVFHQADEMEAVLGGAELDPDGDRWEFVDGFGPDDIPGRYDPFPSTVMSMGIHHLYSRKRLRLESVPMPALAVLLELDAAYPEIDGRHVPASGLGPVEVVALLRRLQDALGLKDGPVEDLDMAERRLAFRAGLQPDDDAALSSAFG